MKKIQFDGAAIPNPGKMAIGVVLLENDNIITKISKKLPNNGTNNVAEYSALLTGISKAIELGWDKVSIEGDSKLVVNQINGTWRINKAHLKSLYNQIISELSKFESYTIKWIPREKNFVADELASKALGYEEDPYHFLKIKNENIVEKEDIGIKCPKCQKDCDFKWQQFKDGSKHIRQECPIHGYIRFAPKVEPYLEKAKQRNDNITQKKLLTTLYEYCQNCKEAYRCKLEEDGFMELCPFDVSNNSKT
jgi:ribonuclease HI